MVNIYILICVSSVKTGLLLMSLAPVLNLDKRIDSFATEEVFCFVFEGKITTKITADKKPITDIIA